MSERSGHISDGLPLPLADELPLHPTIRRWLRTYAAARDGGHDAVVAALLGDWNAMLLETPC